MKVETTIVEETETVRSKRKVTVTCVHDVAIVLSEDRRVTLEGERDGSVDVREEGSKGGEPGSFEMTAAAGGMEE